VSYAVEEVDESHWHAVAARSQEATFFHTPLWAQIAQAAEPINEPFALGATLDDGTEVVLPFIRRRSSGFTALLSTFAGCYGGPVGGRPLSDDETAGLAEAALRHTGAELQMVLGPTTCRPVPRGFRAAPDSTLLLDLPGDFDEVLAGFHPGHRRAYHRSLREGVSARRSAAQADDMEAYAKLYADALGRWGDDASSQYRPETFVALADLAQEHPDAVALWLAELDDLPVAAAWAFDWNGYVSLWHGVARRTEMTMISPPTLLYAEIVRDAIARGARCVDFNPSGGHAGAEAFKRRLGAVERPVLRLGHPQPASPARRAWRAARRALAG
jgi:CelD/BcsL family acetyltransferase involved in cellulose biosynthesis